MKVIVGSPALVRAGAARLAQASRELTDTGGALAGAAGSVTGAWSGPAAVAFGGAAQLTEQACRRTGARMAEVADAGTRYADRLQVAQDELARLASREVRLSEEELVLRVKAAATLPVQLGAPVQIGPSGQRVQTELADVAARRARVAAAAEEILRRHELDRAAFESALSTPPPLATVGDVAGVPTADWTFLTEAKEKWGEAKTVVLRTAKTVSAFRARAAIERIHRMPMPLEAATAADLAAAEKDLAAAGAAFTRAAAPSVPALPGGVADKLGALKAAGGRACLVLTVKDGVTDVVNGDPDHPGFRDVATRVAGAAGATGAVVLLASATNPVGMALVTAYGAYKVGTWIYDHREDIKRVATNAWRRVAPAVEAGGAAVSAKVQEVQRAVGATAAAAGEAVRAKATEVGDRVGAGLRTLVARPRFGW